MLIGDSKKPDPQVNYPVNRPTDSSSASSSSHWNSSTNSYQTQNVDPYLLRNDSAYRERDDEHYASGSGHHNPTERSPLLPPSYTDLHSPHPVDRSTPPLSGTSKPPPKNPKGRVCSTKFDLEFGWKDLLFILVVAALIWGFVTGKIVNAAKGMRGKFGGGGDDWELPWKEGDNGRRHDPSWNEDWGKKFPLNSTFETSPHHCNMFTSPLTLQSRPTHLSSHTTFTLPLHSPLLFFSTHASSQQIAGHIKLYNRNEWDVGKCVPGVENEDWRDDEVKVVVEAVWQKGKEEGWKGWHVCKAGDGKESSGVIISNEYLPPYFWTPSISWNVYFIFPTLESGKAIDVNTLRLRASNMGIEVGEVGKALAWKKVEWETSNSGVRGNVLAADKVDIKSSNAAVVFEEVSTIQPLSIRTSNGKIHVNTCSSSTLPNIVDYHTSNGAISGNICARERITLKTTSGALEVNCDAPSIEAITTNDHIQGQFRGLKGLDSYANGLRLQTSNGRVDVGISVAEGSGKRVGGETIDRLPVTVRSTNAAMDISLDLPPTTQLEADISTSNSKISFHGSPNYQGDFRVSSSSYSTIQVDTASPNGQGKRELEITYSKSGYATGSIYRRGEKKGEKGVVWGRLDIGTTNSGLYAWI